VLGQDERAFMLMDKMFAGRAQTLQDVEAEFKQHKIPAWREYLYMYEVHITKSEIGGKYWAYRWDYQKKKVESEIRAGEIVMKVLFEHDGDWGKVPVRIFEKYYQGRESGFKAFISNVLKDMSVYIVDGLWDRQQLIKGRFAVLGKELSLEDRNWLFEELDALDDAVWDLDPNDIWELNSFVWKSRITEDEFRRCFELAKMYETTDVKAIFPVGS
jgi:hypothetical protein